MIENLKALLTKNPKATLLITVVVVLCGVALYLNADFIPDIWPGESLADTYLSKLKTTQEDLRKAIDKDKELSLIIANLSQDITSFCIPSRDGKPDTLLREKIEKAAADSEVKLSSLGALRTSQIDDFMKSYEISLSTTADISKLVPFIKRLGRGTPKIYWDQYSIRPDNIRDPQSILFNGTVKMVCIESEELVKKVWGDKK